MPIATPTPKCNGYILTSQHPAFPSSTAANSDPYSVIPCPNKPSVPSHLGPACVPAGKGEKVKGKCAEGAWCERHWCGGCKKAREVSEVGLSHGKAKKGVEGVQGGYAEAGVAAV